MKLPSQMTSKSASFKLSGGPAYGPVLAPGAAFFGAAEGGMPLYLGVTAVRWMRSWARRLQSLLAAPGPRKPPAAFLVPRFGGFFWVGMSWDFFSGEDLWRTAHSATQSRGY